MMLTEIPFNKEKTLFHPGNKKPRLLSVASSYAFNIVFVGLLQVYAKHIRFSG